MLAPYYKAIDILERELRIDKKQVDRHSVADIMQMIPVILIAEIYDKKLIDVASDLKRKFIKDDDNE